MAINFPFQYERLSRLPIDVSDVFSSLAAFQTYLASGPAYAGQICAVRNGTNEPDLFRVNENFTHSPVGADGAGGSVSFVYRCTGTVGDATAIAKLIEEFIDPEPPAPARTENTMKLIISGTMIAHNSIELPNTNPRDASIYLDFSDCSISGLPNGLLNIPASQKVYIHGLRARSYPLSVQIIARGQVSITDSSIPGIVRLQGASRCFIRNCEFNKIETTGTPTIIARDCTINNGCTNRGMALFENCQFPLSSARLTNSIDNSVLWARDCFLAGSVYGRGAAYLDRCQVYGSISIDGSRVNIVGRDCSFAGVGGRDGSIYLDNCRVGQSVYLRNGMMTLNNVTTNNGPVSQQSGTLRMRNSSFSRAGGYAGAAMGLGHVHCVAENCHFSTSNYGRTITGRQSNNLLHLINCTVYNYMNGGWAIYADRPLTLDRCRIEGRTRAVYARRMLRITRSRLRATQGLALEIGTRGQGGYYDPAHISDSYFESSGTAGIAIRLARTGLAKISGCMLVGYGVSPIPGPLDAESSKEGKGPYGIRTNPGGTSFALVIEGNQMRNLRSGGGADSAMHFESAGSCRVHILGNLFSGSVMVHTNTDVLWQTPTYITYAPLHANKFSQYIQGGWHES